MAEQELITPAGAETLVRLAALLVTLGGGAAGFLTAGRRGLLMALCGPLVLGMWELHKWLTRYDPATGYFGLEKVSVLLTEIGLFTVLGVVLGLFWRWLAQPTTSRGEE